MTVSLPLRLVRLVESGRIDLLTSCMRGIERETLRVDRFGRLALTPHPKALGAALTNPWITTDYSEALLEFVTPPFRDPVELMNHLDRLHRFALDKLDAEYLWGASMPCELPGEEGIPIARYGCSHQGRLKEVYRKGLALRYGKTMQCIAGVHYNFSVSEGLLECLSEGARASWSPSDHYFALIRNFRRFSWLLPYLFGSSPATDASFLGARAHDLMRFDDRTFFHPFATSLRMGGVGYQSQLQAAMQPSEDCLTNYVCDLERALTQPCQAYADLGMQRDGEWQQLSTNLLQLEHEYYSIIRPKRAPQAGERPIQALKERGVEYVEVRCIDCDPFLPQGIGLEQVRFLDLFLLHCLLSDSPPGDAPDFVDSSKNFQTVVREGRRPGLCLRRDDVTVSLQQWALDLLSEFQGIAECLDRQLGAFEYRQILSHQRAKVTDPTLTPSARVLMEMHAQGEGFQEFSLRKSREHANAFRRWPLDASWLSRLESLAHESHLEAKRLELASTERFEDFLERYVGLAIKHSKERPPCASLLG